MEESEESEENATFLLLLDAIPAVVILASAALAGVSADVAPEHWFWKVMEALFTVFFIGEMLLKISLFGLKDFFWGSDWRLVSNVLFEGAHAVLGVMFNTVNVIGCFILFHILSFQALRYWSWFDLLCIVLALIEMGITYAALASGSATSGGGENVLSLMKMLKLARLGRIIRLLKFKIFQELKLMIQGVFTGLRVLFWAVVLLISCVYLLGVFTRTIYEEDVKEFATVPDAMLTWFRCFTDGCTTFQGAPLQDCLGVGSHVGARVACRCLPFS